MKKPNTPEPNRHYIVWNKHRTEGYVTDDYSDAVHASGGRKSPMPSTSADHWREYQADSGKLKVEELGAE